jgi:hypothetical protein
MPQRTITTPSSIASTTAAITPKGRRKPNRESRGSGWEMLSSMTTNSTSTMIAPA